jgi:ATP-dependent helicase YprA (DUF1998 family)
MSQPSKKRKRAALTSEDTESTQPKKGAATKAKKDDPPKVEENAPAVETDEPFDSTVESPQLDNDADQKDTTADSAGASASASKPRAARPTFSTLPGTAIDPRLIRALHKLKMNNPTPVQRTCIPAAMEGENLVVRAPTGTGKTAAYLVPVLEQILKRKAADKDAKVRLVSLFDGWWKKPPAGSLGTQKMIPIRCVSPHG